MKSTAFLVLSIAACCAQGAGGPAPKFPSDNQDPGKAGAFQMLKAVCPGNVTGGDQIGCATCPNNPDFPGKLRVYSVLRGHFLSPLSDDAILWTVGCDWRLGIPYLLSRKAGKWLMQDDDDQFTGPHADHSTCHKLRVPDGNDALVCLWTYTWRGNDTNTITYHDYKSKGHTDLYSVTDPSQNCGLDPDDEQDLTKTVTVRREFISAVDFEKRPGQPDTVSITVSIGEVAMKPGQCDNLVIPITDSRHIRFPWTGKSY